MKKIDNHISEAINQRRSCNKQSPGKKFISEAIGIIIIKEQSIEILNYLVETKMLQTKKRWYENFENCLLYQPFRIRP